MASALYENGVQSVMAGNIDLINDGIGVLLIDTSLYTPDFIEDESQADIPESAVIAERTLTGKTLDGTTYRGDDLTFPKVTGSQVGGVVLLKDTGEYSTSTLIAFVDNAPEFPITPDGTDITIRWDTGENGIFKL